MATFSASAAMSLVFLLFLSISSPSVTGDSDPTIPCSMLVPSNIMGCFPFMIIGSKEDKPADSCCIGLTTVFELNPECLCEGLKVSGSMEVKINITKAQTLPAACQVNAPSLPSCTSSSTPATPLAPIPVLDGVPKSGPGGPDNSSPSPSHGSSLTPISGLSFVISGTLVVLFSQI